MKRTHKPSFYSSINKIHRISMPSDVFYCGRIDHLTPEGRGHVHQPIRLSKQKDKQTDRLFRQTKYRQATRANRAVIQYRIAKFKLQEDKLSVLGPSRIRRNRYGKVEWKRCEVVTGRLLCRAVSCLDSEQAICWCGNA